MKGVVYVPLNLIVAPAPLPVGPPARLAVEVVHVGALRSRAGVLTPGVVGDVVRAVAGRAVLLAQRLAEGHGGKAHKEGESVHLRWSRQRDVDQGERWSMNEPDAYLYLSSSDE